MVEMLSASTVTLAGRIVACPCCGRAHCLRPLRPHDRRLVVDCGDRTLVMAEGDCLFRRPKLFAR